MSESAKSQLAPETAPGAYEARECLQKQVEQYKAEYEKSGSPDERRRFGIKTLKAMLVLSDLCGQAGDVEKAIEWATEADRIAFLAEKDVGIGAAKRDWAMAATRLGDLYSAQKREGDAVSRYLYALAIYREFAEETGASRARRELPARCERSGDTVGRLPRNKENGRGFLQEEKRSTHFAEEDYQRVYEIRLKLFEKARTPDTRRDLAAILTKLGDLRMDHRDFDGAAEYYARALEHNAILAGEVKIDRSKADYAACLMKLGRVYRAKGACGSAIQYYSAAGELYRALMKKSSLPRYQSSYAVCCEQLAGACMHRGQPDLAEKEFLEAVRTREALDDGSSCRRHELASALFNYASFKKDRELFNKARAIWEQLSVCHPKYKRYIRKTDTIIRQLQRQMK